MWTCDSIPDKGKKIFLPHFVHLSLGLANPPVHTAQGSKLQGREANHSSPFNAKIRMRGATATTSRAFVPGCLINP